MAEKQELQKNNGPGVIEEVKETLSPQEERFELWRNTTGLFLGPLLALVVYLMPLPSLSPTAHLLAAVITLVAVWWITEPIPIPMSALLGAVLVRRPGHGRRQEGLRPLCRSDHLSVPGQLHPRRGNGIHGLDKRFAYGIMSMKRWATAPAGFFWPSGSSAAFSPCGSATRRPRAMMFPIGLGIIYAMAEIMARQTGQTVDPTQAALRHGHDADGGLRRFRRRHRHAGRHPAEPDRHRHDRKVRRRQHPLLPVDGLRRPAR